MGLMHQDFNITNEEIDQRVGFINQQAGRALSTKRPEDIAAAQLAATVATHAMLGDMLKWMKERR